jgi:hypothetical protein
LRECTLKNANAWYGYLTGAWMLGCGLPPLDRGILCTTFINSLHRLYYLYPHKPYRYLGDKKNQGCGSGFNDFVDPDSESGPRGKKMKKK